MGFNWSNAAAGAAGVVADQAGDILEMRRKERLMSLEDERWQNRYDRKRTDDLADLTEQRQYDKGLLESERLYNEKQATTAHGRAKELAEIRKRDRGRNQFTDKQGNVWMVGDDGKAVPVVGTTESQYTGQDVTDPEFGYGAAYGPEGQGLLEGLKDQETRQLQSAGTKGQKSQYSTMINNARQQMDRIAGRISDISESYEYDDDEKKEMIDRLKEEYAGYKDQEDYALRAIGYENSGILGAEEQSITPSSTDMSYGQSLKQRLEAMKANKPKQGGGGSNAEKPKPKTEPMPERPDSSMHSKVAPVAGDLWDSIAGPMGKRMEIRMLERQLYSARTPERARELQAQIDKLKKMQE